MNHIKAQNAGFTDVSKLFLCRYSHARAQANGHKINQIGHAKIQIIVGDYE